MIQRRSTQPSGSATERRVAGVPWAAGSDQARGHDAARSWRRAVLPAGRGPPERDEVGHLTVAFNTMAAAVEDAFATQSHFVADAAHELRTPLTALSR